LKDCFEDVERAQHILWLLHELRSSDEWVFQKQRPQVGGEGLFPLHLLLSHRCIGSRQAELVAARELCKLLIKADSLAVMHGISVGEGLYPLHMAIENGWPCHDLLLAVWPESIELPHPKTGLLPFQAAGSSSTPSTSTATENGAPDLSLDIAFELLRANPMMTISCARAEASVAMDTSTSEAANVTVPGFA
jgi:hypothetical protein